MTKREAIREFNQYVKPAILARYRKSDSVAMSDAWGIFIDGLCRDGRITSKQYHTWTLD